ncbi:MAG TPA: AraC family transcriptional regulator [Hanamia sp.]
MLLNQYDIECIQNARAFIDADITKHYTIVEIAGYAGINTTKLRAGFKKLFNTGLYHYLKEQRLSKGKYLLENTDLSITEISHALGYKYPCNFITAFRKKCGKAPRAWRSQVSLWIIFIQCMQELSWGDGILNL